MGLQNKKLAKFVHLIQSASWNFLRICYIEEVGCGGGGGDGGGEGGECQPKILTGVREDVEFIDLFDFSIFLSILVIFFYYFDFSNWGEV